MADNKNSELNDEMMAKAAGGNSDMPGPKHQIGDRVQLKFSGDDGIVTTVVGVVEDRRPTPSEWEYLIMYKVNGAPYQHWYPEFAV